MQANEKAAKVILKHRNEGHGDYYLDLHGLFLVRLYFAIFPIARVSSSVSLLISFASCTIAFMCPQMPQEEALAAFRAKVAELQSKQTGGEIMLEVIPGAGHHSKNKAVIKPKIIEELTAMKVRFEEKNAGSINVYLGGIEGANGPARPGAQTETASSAAAVESHLGCCVVM